MDIEGKNIIITGGARGLGRQFAIDLKVMAQARKSFALCKSFATRNCPFNKKRPPTSKAMNEKCENCEKWEPFEKDKG